MELEVEMQGKQRETTDRLEMWEERQHGGDVDVDGGARQSWMGKVTA